MNAVKSRVAQVTADDARAAWLTAEEAADRRDGFYGTAERLKRMGREYDRARHAAAHAARVARLARDAAHKADPDLAALIDQAFPTQENET